MFKYLAIKSIYSFLFKYDRRLCNTNVKRDLVILESFNIFGQKVMPEERISYLRRICFSGPSFNQSFILFHENNTIKHLN